MRRTLTLTLISLISVLAAACTGGGGGGGGEAPPPETPVTVENPCVQPAAPPKEGETPTCSDGCKWSGTECRQERGIIIDQRPLQAPTGRPAPPAPK
jgi:hypothetical protein